MNLLFQSSNIVSRDEVSIFYTFYDSVTVTVSLLYTFLQYITIYIPCIRHVIITSAFYDSFNDLTSF